MRVRRRRRIAGFREGLKVDVVGAPAPEVSDSELNVVGEIGLPLRPHDGPELDSEARNDWPGAEELGDGPSVQTGQGDQFVALDAAGALLHGHNGRAGHAERVGCDLLGKASRLAGFLKTLPEDSRVVASGFGFVH